jgi:hypothetical protein
MSKEEPIDVRDMAIVHRTFRTAYDEAARLVRAAPVPSSERVTFLADHIDFSINMLNIHHDGEEHPAGVGRAREAYGGRDSS